MDPVFQRVHSGDLCQVAEFPLPLSRNEPVRNPKTGQRAPDLVQQEIPMSQ